MAGLWLACDGSYDRLVPIRPTEGIRRYGGQAGCIVAGGRIVTPTLINTLRPSDGGMVVEIRGEIDVVHAERLRQVLVDASRERPTVLVVDLLYVTFIDSTGIGALAAGYNAARRFGVRFAIRRPSPFIVTQLRQTGLYDVLTTDR
jgi:anti-anti-sigma factor